MNNYWDDYSKAYPRPLSASMCPKSEFVPTNVVIFDYHPCIRCISDIEYEIGEWNRGLESRIQYKIQLKQVGSIGHQYLVTSSKYDTLPPQVPCASIGGFVWGNAPYIQLRYLPWAEVGA